MTLTLRQHRRIMGTFQYSGNVIGIMLLSFILSSMLLRCPTLCTASSSTNGGSSRSFGLQLEIVSKIEPQSVVIQNPAKSYLKGNRRDQTLIVDDGADNASSAYLKCYGALDEVATSTLNQEDYIVFLQTMTDGGISVSGFQELPAVFAMIFYTAACVGEDDCVGDNVPAIEIGTTEEPAGDLQLFCKQILKSTESVTETPFEYSIRYDSSTLEEGTLANCLAEATVNILLEQLTTCVAAEGRRRLSESRELASAVRKTISNLQGEQSQRFLQVLGSASSGAIDCDYRIDVTVDRITDSACEGAAAGENERCALVRSTANVAALQILEPFASLLRVQVVTILRDAINTGRFTELLSSGECAIPA